MSPETEVTPEDRLTEFDFNEDDVGAYLLESITRGLYRDPRNALREYVSNELDNLPRPKNVSVNIRGNQVEIAGDGPGMGYDQVRGAVRVGFSSKDPQRNIGFRGIGIYSGVSVCDRIRISTKKSGTDKAFVIVIDAKGLREDMGTPTKTSKTSLIGTLRKNVRHAEFSTPPDQRSKHGTVVTLFDVLDSASELLDEDGVRAYLENIIPIELAPKFPQREKIEKFLLAQVRRDYRLTSLNFQGDPVYRAPNLPDLLDPETGTIKINGRQIGCYWFCLSQGRRKIKDPSLRGLVLRKKGFSIGDRSTVQKLFKANANLVNWVTGEIHITAPELIPNAERVELEPGRLRTQLEDWIRDTLGGRISDLAREQSATGRADIRIAEAKQLKSQPLPTTWDDLIEEMHQTKSLLEDLETDRRSSFLPKPKKSEVRAAAEQATARFRRLNKASIALRPKEDLTPSPSALEEAEPIILKAHPGAHAAPEPPPEPLAGSLRQRVAEMCGRTGRPDWSEVIYLVLSVIEGEGLLPSDKLQDLLDQLERRLVA